MQFPESLRYTKEHEWVRVEGSCAVVGITEFAQKELGEIVFADLPAPGKKIKAGETLCVVESTKAASDVYAPISGEVKEGNAALTSAPDLINSSPYQEGWMVKLENFDTAAVQKLMSATEYRNFLGDKV